MISPGEDETVSVPDPRPVSASSSVYLDAFRAVAALAVMSSHLRQFCFVDYSHIQPANFTVPIRILYFLTRFGRQSVMIFFVLSGFFIGSSALRKIHYGKWSWRDYSIDRGVRLYMVFVPGLILGWAWDSIGIKLFNASGIYSTTLRPFGDSIPLEQRSLLDFFGNLFFLQTRFVPVFGSNSPLWSLFNECWYYILFPCIVWSIVHALKRRCGFAIVFALLAAGSIWILKYQMEGFAIWALGCCVSLTDRYFGGGKHKENLVTSLCISCSALGLCIALPFGNDLAIGICFASLLYWTLQLDKPPNAGLSNYVKSWAAFSYSLYILHFPALFLIRAACFPRERWQPDGSHLFYAAVIGTFIFTYAFAISRLTEAKTARVRDWLRRRIVR